jgi:CRP-like cAMP-binding protein
MQILFNRTIREKLIAYLSMESKKAGDKEFFITFDRNELADYLAVNRSAMSRELGKMREEGILDFSKNKFILY